MSRPYTIEELALNSNLAVTTLSSHLVEFATIVSRIQIAAKNGHEVSHLLPSLDRNIDIFVSDYMSCRQWTDQLTRTMKEQPDV